MNNYLPYVQAGEEFYERRSGRGEEKFSILRDGRPEGWSLGSDEHWTYLTPHGLRIREQGWKVHISVTVGEAEETVRIAANYCVAQRVPFKFLTSPRIHEVSNRKDAARGSSGKLVTIYPGDDDELLEILEKLGSALTGRPGPYILGDLRWGNGPLYLRYGGFQRLECRDEAGRTVPAIRTPDGTLVADVRGPGFIVPDWAIVPKEIDEHISSSQAASEDLPYRIEKALHFSNGGGIYRAVDPTSGRSVILREARPHAGLDAQKQDAVARLHHEARVLEDLRDLDFVPTPYRCFTVWEHHYLAEEYFDGPTLWEYLAMTHPLTRSDPDPVAVQEYTATVLDVGVQLERALSILHRRGYVYADLHPRNVILRPDGAVALVDFEAAYRPGVDEASAMGAPGFLAGHARSDADRDTYSLNSLRLSVLLPMTQVLDLDPNKVDDLVEAAGQLFPVPAEYLDELRAGLRRPDAPEHPVPLPSWFRAAAEDRTGTALESLIEKMAVAIRHSATPERRDRLFPGAPQGLEDGGYNLAHGASGVLLALSSAGQPVDEDHLDWLVEAVRRSPARPGLYEGMHGAALALHALGRGREALEILDRLEPDDVLSAPGNLYRGLAGIGLVLRYFAQLSESGRWEDQLSLLTTRLSELVAAPARRSAPGPAGLFDGDTGAALFFLRRYQDGHDPALLDLARVALENDLRQCEGNDSGEFLLKDGARLLPYLGSGSAGLLEPLGLYTSYRQDEHLSGIAAAIRRTCAPVFTIDAGLAEGRAGLMIALAGVSAENVQPDVLRTHVERLAWHAIRRPEGVAFPGSLLRLSMDLCTGTAGVMFALSQCARHLAPNTDPSPELIQRTHALGLPLAR